MRYLHQIEWRPFLLYLVSAFKDASVVLDPQARRRRIEELLALEKRRRKVDADTLVFLAMSELASYYWCAVKSLLRSKENEPDFFGAYLVDRIEYSLELGRTLELPKDPEELLKIGSNLRFEDIEELLQKRRAEMEKSGVSGVIFSSLETTDEKGQRIIIVNPDVSDEILLPSSTATLVDVEKFPKLRGEMIETTRAEHYPTIRWNFPWKEFVIVGVPDGITDSFVYEFKTVRDSYLELFIKPVAFAQADLYGYFFQRPEKRVQICAMKENEIHTWQEKVQKEKAIDLMSSFSRLVQGERPVPPRPWKCKRCEYRPTCLISRR
jgi:hypothetical protein